MKGRPPIPTRIKMIQGTYRPDREGGVDIGCMRPEMPPFVHGDRTASREWTRVVDALVKSGVIHQIDSGALAAYCIAVSDLERAVDRLAADGEYTMTQFGLKPHPAVRMKQHAMNQIRQLGGLLGLNPISRQRMKAMAPPEPDEFDMLPNDDD